jgi:hypothetical protein
MMDEHIAESCETFPRNFRMNVAVFVGDALSGFADNLKVADNGILDQRVREKSLPAPGRIIKNPVATLKYLGQVNPRIFGHIGLASFNIRLRRSQ